MPPSVIGGHTNGCDTVGGANDEADRLPHATSGYEGAGTEHGNVIEGEPGGGR
jgi:hypothetical protein